MAEFSKQHVELGDNDVVCQKWEERERGWGARPDGFSLHLTFGGLRQYIQEHWDSLPDVAPDEYSKPDGEPYPVGVAETVRQQIEANGGSLRYFSNYQYPGSGGVDGWMPVNRNDT